MKPLLSCNKTRNDGNIQLLENGNIIKEPSTLFNNYFSKPIISQAALKPAVDDFKDHPSINKIKIHAPALEFSFQPVSCKYLTTLQNSVNSKKSCGPDGISPRLLKLSTPSIAAPLTRLINLCIMSSTWPALSKVYPKVAALRRLKRLVPHDTIIRLYKACVVPHYDYCSPLLLGIGKTISHKLESVNSFALRTLLNLDSNTGYDHVLGLSSMHSIEHRRYEQSLTLFYKCVKEQGPAYINNLFKPRSTQYNLRNSGLNVEQPSYSGLFYHNSFTYRIAHIWNQLPTSLKSTTSLSEFRKQLTKIDLHSLKSSCLCQHCLA